MNSNGANEGSTREVSGAEGHRLYWTFASATTLIIMTAYVLSVNERWSFFEYLWAGILFGLATMFGFLMLEIVAVIAYWILTAIHYCIVYVCRRIHRLVFPSWYKTDQIEDTEAAE